MRAYRLREPWCTVSHIMVTSWRSKWAVGAIRRGPFRRVFATCGKGRAPARPAAARPMIESGAAPPMVDALRRVRRWMSRRVFCRFCHARSRVPMVFGPFHDCAFCERAAPDALETIDDQRRCTGCRYRTIYGGSRGSASLPRRRSGSVLVYDLTDSLRTRLNCMAPRSMAALISSGRIGLLR